MTDSPATPLPTDTTAPAVQRGLWWRVRHAFREWLLRRRRARAGKGRRRSKRVTIVLSFLLVGLLGVFAYCVMYLRPDPRGQELSLDELSALADEKRIESAQFLDEDSLVTGAFSVPAPEPELEPAPKDGKGDRAKATEGQGNDAAKAKKGGKGAGPDRVTPEPDDTAPQAPPGSGDYWVSYPASDAVTAVLVEMVTGAGARVVIDPQSTKQGVRLVTTFLLPLMILANLFALLFTAARGGGGGIGEVMMFSQIGQKRVRRGLATAVTFADVAGADEAVAELREVRDYLSDPEKYEEIGATPPKGILLVGPPGCGKTLMAKAVAGEAQVPFFSVAGAEFVESLVGVGAARVRDLFLRVRGVAPAIVFIDELDAAGRRRGHGGGGGGSDEREQTLNQMLVEMDGFDVSSGIVVIGATNRPDILDPALLRPGRFDRHVTVDQPDLLGREAILRLHGRGRPMESDVDFEYLAKRTPGFSGADLANVINEAALLTVREGKVEIHMPEMEEAIQRVLSGPKKKGRVLSDEERKRVAYHESGHAIVSAAVGRHEDVHRVTILARGKGVGLTNVRRESDAVLLTRGELVAQLVTYMGGLAAEELVFGDPSTGAEQDLEHATDLARDMVGRFGMGSRRRRLLAKEIDEFLNEEAELAQISDQTHEEMEAEVDRLLKDAEQEARRLLQQHGDVLETMAARLEEEETIEGAELESVLAPVRPKGDGKYDGGRAVRPAAEVRKRSPSS